MVTKKKPTKKLKAKKKITKSKPSKAKLAAKSKKADAPPSNAIFEQAKPIMDELFKSAMNAKGELNERMLLYQLTSHIAVHIMKFNEIERMVPDFVYLLEHLKHQKHHEVQSETGPETCQ